MSAIGRDACDLVQAVRPAGDQSHARAARKLFARERLADATRGSSDDDVHVAVPWWATG
jgi:hypothetical protein